MIEAIDTGYHVLDDDGRVLDANAAYVRLTGHTSLNEILGRRVTEWTAPHDRQKSVAAIEACVKTGSVRHLKIEYVGPDRLVTPAGVSVMAVETARETRVVSLCRDISKRRGDATGPGEPAGLLAVALAGARMGAWELKPDLTVDWSESSADLFGMGPGTFPRHVAELMTRVHPDDRDLAEAEIARLRARPADGRINARVIWPDGGEHWHAVFTRSIGGEDAIPNRLAGISLEITARKPPEKALDDSGTYDTGRERMQQLREAAAQWQATFDATRHQMMVLSPELRIRKANAAASAFLELPAAELVGRPCHVLMHGADKCIDGCPATSALLTKAHAEAEILHTGKNVWLWVSADPILDANGTMTGVVHTVREVTERKRAEEERRQVFEEVQRLRDRLHQENIYLRQEARGLHGQPAIVGQSAAMRRALSLAEQVASTGSSVLLLGETGTGKDRLAAYIHSLSPRRDRTMVRVSCSAIPTALMESELFGREKGAYTGALSKQIGRFELAHGSTLFLDEIGELPAEVQVKLLRVLQEKQIERLGSPKPITVDVRIIAASNRNLEEATRSGGFREDLYYRLNVFPIVVPPLRERREDIPLLVQAFVDELATTMGRRVESISKGSLDRLTRHAWPGNVRELRNVIERALILSTGPTLNVDLPTRSTVAEVSPGRPIEEVEREHILRVLEQTGWRVRGTHGAAVILGMKPTTLESRMKKLGVRRPRH